MNRTIRSILAITAVIGTVTALSACSSPTSSGSSTSDLKGQTISFLSVQDPFYFALKDILPQFEKETGIKVKLEGVDYDTMNSRATNSFTSKQGDIDVIAPDQMWLSRFAQNGWLEKLDDRITADKSEVNLSDFNPNALYTQSEWDNHLYTLPVATYGTMVLYRPTVFKALGLATPPAEPSASWTWDKYLADVKAINGQKVNGVDMHGTVVLGAGPQPITHMYAGLAASYGASWIKAFPNASTWDFTPQFTSAKSIDALTTYKELYQNSPADSINYLWFDAGTRFGTGDIGMMYHSTPYAYLVQRTEYMGSKTSAIGDDYALAALPSVKGVPAVTNIQGYSLGVGANSAHKDAAWAFVKWATSAATQKKMALLPLHQFADFARTSLYKDKDLLTVYPWLPQQLSNIADGDGKAARPPLINYSTVEQAIGNNLNKMLANDASAASVGEAINSDVTKIMKNEQYMPWTGDSYADSLSATKKLLSKLEE